ncbi:MAG: type I DNA topoisomerase, partial [Alphaproteobacteria bacterium]|nr:type I DNA topoisomerase [Alphaproteobacteria bacterium]
MNVVIVESPAKAKTITKYLGKGYEVYASYGHVRDLPAKDGSVDPDADFVMLWDVDAQSSKRLAEIAKAAKGAEKIILATDPDREGEAISWHVLEVLKAKKVLGTKPVARVVFNAITKAAVQEAMRNPREIDAALVDAYLARRALDYLVGFNLSPVLWRKLPGARSAGRVQSVATRIIVEREEEIRAFVPQEYWLIDALLETTEGKTFTAKFYGDVKTKNKIELKNEEDAMNVVDKITGKPFKVLSVKKAVKQKNPAPPFETSTLQQEAAHKLNFQSAKTMKVAQELYEGVNIGPELGGAQGLISYMRTDSLHISAEASAAAKELIGTKYGEKYVPANPRVYKSKAGAQDAHEAIRPANPNLEPEMIQKFLSADQYKLYKLIWSRFIASQMASAELDTVNVDIVCEDYLFRASGYTIKFQGYMAVYESSEPDDDSTPKTALPNIKDGEILKAKSITPSQHFTEPPPRYTEATLIKFLKEEGIGRPSTYTP